ncbi:MAG: aryl-sulfate sulfotransferase [Phycisphaerales bacterium]|nr:aryl-sulfate sulfotransferase [Phycisphaerales bacterium]
MSVWKQSVSVAVLATLVGVTAAHGERTVGLLEQQPGTADGYVLWSPLNGTDAFLIDNNGRLVNQWSSTYQPGVSTYLLEDGSLLRTGRGTGNADFVAGGQGGMVERYSWDGTLEWSYRYSEAGLYKSHHDIHPMANGNVLILAWEMKTEAECIAAGRDPSTLQEGELWPEHVIEVQPTGFDTGEIVWEWHIWDHLIQNFDPLLPNYGDPIDYPGRMDINSRTNDEADWLHANALHYNEELDQIMLCIHRGGEIWIVDHDLTTEEAAGPAGDIMYRWGNPSIYNRNADDSDRKLYGQHDARWIPEGYPGAGNILVFNNGQNRPEGLYTTIEEITPPLLADGTYELDASGIYGPADSELVYISDTPEDFYASFISGAERQPNGNTLICSGPWGDFFEVTPASDIVWRYMNPVTADGPLSQGQLPDGQGPNSTVNRVFRASRYPTDFAGFVGKDMTPGLPLEIYDGDCLPDLNGDLVVGVEDLLDVINRWGTGAGDVQGDGRTDVEDILLVVDRWGQCE